MRHIPVIKLTFFTLNRSAEAFVWRARVRADLHQGRRAERQACTVHGG